MIPLGLVHDEAERHHRDGAGHLARVRRASTPSRRSSRPAATASCSTDLERWLAEITGYDAVSLQPNAGSQGEFAGLLAIRAYHARPGEPHRDVCLIPASAHGTNAASAAMAGLRVVVVACDDDGNVDVADLKRQAPHEHADRLAALMVTYPSTHGVFEADIRDICAVVHDARRPGVPRRRQPQRAGRARPARAGSAPTCRTSTCTRRSASPTAAAARASARSACAPTSPRSCPNHPLRPRGRAGHRDRADQRGALGLGRDPADLVGVHPADGRRRAAHARPRSRSSTPTTWPAASPPHYPVLYTGPRRARRPRVHPRPAAHHRGDRRHRRRRRQAAHRLRLPRADDVVPGRGHADGRADRVRVAGRARPLLRRDDRHPRRDRRRRRGGVAARGQPAAPRPAHRRRRARRRRGRAPTRASWRRSRCPALRTDKYWPPVGRIDSVYGDRNVFCSCPPLEDLAGE